MSQAQSTRMDNEVSALRDLLEEAKTAQNTSQVIQLSRVIVQTEQAIEKQRQREGYYVERTEIVAMRRDLVDALTRAGKRVLPKDLYDALIDETMAELSEIWV